MERNTAEPGTARNGALLERFQVGLERLRGETGLSRCAFADRIGIARSTYFQVMGPEGNPSLGTVETIARSMGVDPLALLANEPPAKDAALAAAASDRGASAIRVED